LHLWCRERLWAIHQKLQFHAFLGSYIYVSCYFSHLNQKNTIQKFIFETMQVFYCVFDVKSSYVAFKLFHLGSAIFRLLFERYPFRVTLEQLTCWLAEYRSDATIGRLVLRGRGFITIAKNTENSFATNSLISDVRLGVNLGGRSRSEFVPSELSMKVIFSDLQFFAKFFEKYLKIFCH